ncbi:hypothetical protein A4X13_0g2782 [Tilletia indica]|uniref:DUF6589 domain-containing protein n=1 Tax=Tilletia indica TaxID=43049 RepID=A0A177TAN0_9BASI|nr:hypothetical protein A4X13_0g2782 [Tilletia indica]
MSFPARRPLFSLDDAGPSLSRPPSFALSQPVAGPSRQRDFPSSPASSSTIRASSSLLADIQRDIDDLFGEDDADEEEVDALRVPAAAPTPRRRKLRRSEMNDRDVIHFLRFMSERNLSIKSLLSLFFDAKPAAQDPDEAIIPGDEMLSSDALSSRETVASHTSQFLRTRISQWLSTEGPSAVASRWKGAPTFALSLVCQALVKEAKNGTKLEYLRGPAAGKTTLVDLESFDPETSANLIREMLPTMHSVLSAIAGADVDHQDGSQDHSSQTEDAEDQPSEEEEPAAHFKLYGQRGRAAVIASCAHTLLFGRDSRCNRWPMQLSVDLVGARVPKRSCELLSRLGFIGAWRSAQRVLDSMAKDDHDRVKRLVTQPSSAISLSYDNVNWQRGVRDKRTEKKQLMMAAVCGMAYLLDYQSQYDDNQPICSDELFRSIFNADVPRPLKSEPSPMNPLNPQGESIAMKRFLFDEARAKVKVDDIKLSELFAGRAEEEHLLEAVVSHAARTWTLLHEDSGVEATKLPQPPQILPFLPARTHTMGLPVLNEDEGSVAGNIAVIYAYLKFLGIDDDDRCGSHVLPVVADALTVSHLRSALARRVYDKSTKPNIDQLQFLQPMTAFFHLQYNFQRYWLDAHAGTAHNQSKISARILCDRVGMKTLCTGGTDFHDMDAFLKMLFAALVDARVTPALRAAGHDTEGAGFGNLSCEELVDTIRRTLGPMLRGSAETTALDHGDPDNADLLFLQTCEMFRDTAIYLELRDAVKTGDPGRVLAVAKFTVPRFAATGHHRYSSEVLDMLVLARYELPPAMVTTMLCGTLINHAGKKDSWFAADLDIEHQVNELKNIFKVTSGNDAVTRGHIGQIITSLRRQRARWYRAVGVTSRDNKHTMRSMRKSVEILVRDFVDRKVFDWTSGRASKAYELHRGDEVRRRKLGGERNAKQAKGVATDFHTYGYARLSGTEAVSFANWRARRFRDTGKGRDAMVLPTDGVDDLDTATTTITYDIEDAMDDFVALIDDEA